MKKKNTFKMGVGISLLLIILIVISMTVLSVLALLSSVNDQKLSQKRAAHVVELARAVAVYENALFTLNEAAVSGKDLVSSLPEGAVLSLHENDEATLDIGFGQDMAVTARILVASSGVERLTFEIANLAEWETDDTVDLFSGEYGAFDFGLDD